MVEIKGIPPALAKAAKDAAKKDRDEASSPGRQNPNARPEDQQRTRLARPDEEAKIQRDQHKGDLVNHADDNDIERCRTNKDLETHTRLARPDEEKAIQEKHARKRAEARGEPADPPSAKQQEADAAEAAASFARRQALGGV